MMEGGWSGDLGAALGRIGLVATGGGLRVLRGGGRMALGLPEDGKAAEVVLAFYQPQRLKGRLFGVVAKGLVRTGLYRRVLSAQGVGGGVPEVEWLREAAAAGRVGFMGCNPAHGLRCIVGGVDGGGAPFVGKLGFDEGRDGIVREGEVLEKLGGMCPGVLKALSLERGEDWALLRLPHLGNGSPERMEDPGVVAFLGEWLGEERKALGAVAWAKALLDRAERAGVDAEWCAGMRGREVRTAVVHGDFAVWNLRLGPEGPCAIDWEWAVEEGVGGIDLAYGLRQEALLVQRLGAAEAVRRMLGQGGQGAMKEYLDRCGWGDSLADWLRLGLLYSHLNVGQDSGELLRELGVNLESGFVTR